MSNVMKFTHFIWIGIKNIRAAQIFLVNISVKITFRRRQFLFLPKIKWMGTKKKQELLARNKSRKMFSRHNCQALTFCHLFIKLLPTLLLLYSMTGSFVILFFSLFCRLALLTAKLNIKNPFHQKWLYHVHTCVTHRKQIKIVIVPPYKFNSNHIVVQHKPTINFIVYANIH